MVTSRMETDDNVAHRFPLAREGYTVNVILADLREAFRNCGNLCYHVVSVWVARL